MQRSWKLKLLSGALPGVEYVICEGDALFCVGSRKDLLNGVVGETIGRAENTYYIPDDHDSLVFVVRVRRADEITAASLGERDDVTGEWSYREISLNEIQRVGGLFLALREDAEPWSEPILNFVPPRGIARSAEVMQPAGKSSHFRRLAIGTLVSLGVMAIGVALYQGFSPTVKIDDMTKMLRTAPYDFSLSYGRDGKVHVFSDSGQGRAWAQRAAERRGLSGAYVFLDRHAERQRIGDLIVRQGSEYTIIRLDDPRHPTVVVSGTTVPAEPVRDRLRMGLLQTMPYAEDIKVVFVSDARLQELATEGLAAVGVPVRFHREAAVWVATNDAYISDAQINGMRQFAHAFSDEWGDRRLAIHIRLWDDLLKGRSYQYGADQLLSMGDGRWEFSTRTLPSARSN